jgi:hypothetical protein
VRPLAVCREPVGTYLIQDPPHYGINLSQVCNGTPVHAELYS